MRRGKKLIRRQQQCRIVITCPVVLVGSVNEEENTIINILDGKMQWKMEGIETCKRRRVRRAGGRGEGKLYDLIKSFYITSFYENINDIDSC